MVLQEGLENGRTTSGCKTKCSLHSLIGTALVIRKGLIIIIIIIIITSREDMQIFIENIEDHILFLTFYGFSGYISIFEVNILHPIIVFSFL